MCRNIIDIKIKKYLLQWRDASTQAKATAAKDAPEGRLVTDKLVGLLALLTLALEDVSNYISIT